MAGRLFPGRNSSDWRNRGFEDLPARITSPHVANAARFDVRARRGRSDHVAAFAEKAMLTEPDLALIGYAGDRLIIRPMRRMERSHGRPPAAALRDGLMFAALTDFPDILQVAISSAGYKCR